MHSNEVQYHDSGAGSVGITRDGPVSSAAALLTIGVGAFAWVILFPLTIDMDMTHVPGLISFPSFINQWMWMLAAMMLPAAAPAAFRHARISNSLRELLVFIGSYCGVWTLVGIALYAVYPLYRAYGPVAAGTVAIAAGMYELTPLKQRLRRRCLETFGSGVQFGLCCVGSSIGLMLLMLAVDLMSITWMLVLAVLMLTQKVLPAKAVIDVPLAFAMVGLGILMVVPPGSIPGVMPLL